MHNKLPPLAASLATLLIAATAQAADMTVTAKVFPSACSLNVGDGGTFDVGDISHSSLSAEGADTPIATNFMSFDLQCQAPTLIGLKTFDNRLGSAAEPENAADEPQFGLGVDHSGNKIGNYSLATYIPTINGAPGYLIYSTNNGQTWSSTWTNVFFQPNNTNYITSFTSVTETTPIAVDSVAGTLWARVEINDKAELDLSRVIEIDGLTTMELTYL